MSPHSRESDRRQLERLVQYLRPTDKDPIYLVLKTHLVVEEVLIDFLRRQAPNPKHIDEVRLNFSQLVSLAQAFYRFRDHEWWVWPSLKKLNSLRNLLAHNLEPRDLTDRIADLSVFVAEAIGATSDSDIAKSYEKLATTGVHPFVLALVALHMALSTGLGYDPEEMMKPAKQLP